MTGRLVVELIHSSRFQLAMAHLVLAVVSFSDIHEAFVGVPAVGIAVLLLVELARDYRRGRSLR